MAASCRPEMVAGESVGVFGDEVVAAGATGLARRPRRNEEGARIRVADAVARRHTSRNASVARRLQPDL